jgi:hypothetical protein
MQTATTSSHIVRLAADLLAERDLAALSEEQAKAVADAIDRWCTIPLQLPNAADVSAYNDRHPRDE